MNILSLKKLTETETALLLKRPNDGKETILSVVQEICINVRKRGDEAVHEYGDLYEPLSVDIFKVPDIEFDESRSGFPETLLSAVQAAEKNIRKFHETQLQGAQKVIITEGIECRREIRPYELVGLYVPAGSAPLPSTVLMLGIPATLAQCGRIIICSPPNASGKIDPSVLVTADLLGIREIYKIGGAQAIAAMAYGTESVPKVDKIFGPGNRYVTAAKQVVSSDPDGAAIDMLAGPSELLVIADDSANPKFVAADLLSQAEHDPYSQVILVTTSPALAENVGAELKKIPDDVPRKKIMDQSLGKSYILIVDSLDTAVDFSNRYAPEHLSLQVKDPERLTPQIQNAGSVFLGDYSPVTAGDYASGTNHTLPTGGYARRYGGLTVESFQKTITFQALTRPGLKELAPVLTALAEAEGLAAHKQAVMVRIV